MRICTYNCMNLFAWEAEPQEPVNAAKPQREVLALAKTLSWANPDLVSMQEVGSLSALKDLNSLLKTPFAHLLLAQTNSDRGIHLGFMSRYPLKLHSYRESPLLDEEGNPITDILHRDGTQLEPMRLQRDIAVVEIGQTELSPEPPNSKTDAVQVKIPPMFVANVHLKSAGKRPWNTLSPLVVRSAEVRVLAGVITGLQKRNPGCELMVMGDFNDNPTSPAFAALAQLDHGVLYDPLMRELVPANPRISTYWPKRRTRIDRILLNSQAKKRYLPGSIRLWGNKRAEIASDHFPLSIDMVPPTPEKKSETDNSTP